MVSMMAYGAIGAALGATIRSRSAHRTSSQSPRRTVPRAPLLGLVRPTTHRRSDILEAGPGPWTLDPGETEELPVTTPSPSEVRSVLLDLVRRRGAGKTVCPSEAARALAAEG